MVLAAPGVGADHGPALATLTRLLSRHGWAPEVLVLDDAEPPSALDASIPVLVVDRLRRTGPGRVALALGARRGATALKGWRLRRWTRSRADAAWIVHPGAAALLGFVDPRPPLVIGALLDPADDVRIATDGPFADAPEMWITVTEDQRRQVADATGRPAHCLGGLRAHHLPWPLPPAGSRPGPVFIVSSAPLTEVVDHATEVIWQVARRRPDLTFTWAVATEDDRRRAGRDLVRLGLAERASVVGTDQAWPERPILVVSTSAAPLPPELGLTASLGAIPTVGFDLGDLPGGQAAAPDEVEGLVAAVDGLLSDPDRAAAEGARLQRAARNVHDLEQRAAPLLVRLADPDHR